MTTKWLTKLNEAVTAVLHYLAPHAKVVGIEHIEELAEQSKANLAADGVKVGPAGGVEIIQGDGRLGQLPPCGSREEADNQDHQLTVGKLGDEG